MSVVYNSGERACVTPSPCDRPSCPPPLLRSPPRVSGLGLVSRGSKVG